MAVVKPAEVVTEDKKKGKVEKVKKCIRTAAGISWEDPSLLDWETGKYFIVSQALGKSCIDPCSSWTLDPSGRVYCLQAATFSRSSLNE